MWFQHHLAGLKMKKAYIHTFLDDHFVFLSRPKSQVVTTILMRLFAKLLEKADALSTFDQKGDVPFGSLFKWFFEDINAYLYVDY